MPSSWTTSLKIQLMETGENSTTWGDVTNDNLRYALEQAIVGSANVTFNNGDATVPAMTNSNGSQEGRNMRLVCTGDAGSSDRTLTVPTINKVYIIRNDLLKNVTVKTAAQVGGVVIAPQTTMWVYVNGVSVVDVVTYLSSLTLGTALNVTSGGTGANTAFTQGSVVFAGASGVYTQDNANFFWDSTNKRLGIGTITPSSGVSVDGDTIGIRRYAAGANLNLSRAAGTKAAPAANGTDTGLGGIFVQSYDGANYQNAAYIRFVTNGTTTSGSSAAGIQFQTTSLNSTSVSTKMTLTSEGDLSVTGGLTLGTALNVASGGTGANTLTNNAVIIGNATSEVKFVAPGTSGNILTSNGTAWLSQAPAASGNVASITGTANQIIASASTGAVTLSTPQSINTTSNVQFASFGVGTPASGTTGEIRATNNITAYFSSDARFKENIQDIEGALDAVCAIGGKIFDWSDQYIAEHGGEDGYFVRKRDFGMIAQDVMKNFPLGARARPDETLAVDYEKMCALAFQAIKELRAEVEKLKGSK